MFFHIFSIFAILYIEKHKIEYMIIVNVKENESIDKALKRFKKKFEKTGVLKELRARSYYEKKSVERRNEIIRAAYRERMKKQEIE